MSGKKIFNLVFWIIIIGIFIFVGYTYYSRQQEQMTLDQIEERVEVPDFELKNLQGETVKLSDYKGKVVFLNFWAEWCKYCVQEMPDLNRANEKLKKEGNAIILAVDVREDPQKVKEFIEERNLTLPVLLDETGKVAAMYGIQSFPTTYIINPDGTLYNGILGKTDEKTILRLAKKVWKKSQ